VRQVLPISRCLNSNNPPKISTPYAQLYEFYIDFAIATT
jgi:hypothetical protein